MKRTLLAAALIVFTLPAAQADECKDPQDQATLNECASKSYKASDAKLNALYRDIEHRLADDPDTKKLLVSAQRAWIVFRDAECGFSSSMAAGGSAYPMVHTMCLDGLTQRGTTDQDIDDAVSLIADALSRLPQSDLVRSA